MKIAIAAEGSDIESEVSMKGGRAPFYLIFEEGKLLEALKNPFVAGSGGAGFSIAYLMAEKGVGLVIAGKIGKNMVDALESKGVDFREEERQLVSEVVKSI